MGQMKSVAFAVAIILFLGTALVVFCKPETAPSIKKQPLSLALSEIDGWHASGNIALQKKVIATLQLDDFLFRNYKKDNRSVGLYIGYYLTSGKVGAAHDPLVCLPGQGWHVTQRGKGKLKIDGDLTISYAKTVVEREGERDLYLYWFQTYDQAVAGTFAQKIVSLSNKLKGGGEDNAFVRLNCSLNESTQKECMQILTGFIQDFYPIFLNYIREGNR